MGHDQDKKQERKQWRLGTRHQMGTGHPEGLLTMTEDSQQTGAQEAPPQMKLKDINQVVETDRR